MNLKVAFLTTRDSQGQPGTGDCIVITFVEETLANESRKACIVIDGGRSETRKELKKYLDNENITIINLMVATHIDDDHVYGLFSFLREYASAEDETKFKLMNYWGPAPENYGDISITKFLSYLPDIENQNMEELSFISQSWRNNEKLYNRVTELIDNNHIYHPSVDNRDNIPSLFKSIKIEILAPDIQIPDIEIEEMGPHETKLANILVTDGEIDLINEELRKQIDAVAIEDNRTANNQSIVFRLTPIGDNGNDIKDLSILFTGDAEIDSWEYMIEKWDSQQMKAKVLKVSHHGSITGTKEKILDIIEPKYSIICCGRNTYGLPDESVLKMINERNIKIFCTGRNDKKKSPCISNKVLKKCARRDYANSKEIEDTIVFEFDTDSKTISPSEYQCKFNW